MEPPENKFIGGNPGVGGIPSLASHFYIAVFGMPNEE